VIKIACHVGELKLPKLLKKLVVGRLLFASFLFKAYYEMGTLKNVAS